MKRLIAYSDQYIMILIYHVYNAMMTELRIWWRRQPPSNDSSDFGHNTLQTESNKGFVTISGRLIIIETWIRCTKMMSGGQSANNNCEKFV